MNAPVPRLPVEQFARSPELASLSILGAAITACQAALLAAHPDVAHGATEDCPRGSSALRAEASIPQKSEPGSASAPVKRPP